MASMSELGSTLSIEDCYDLIEIAIVDAHNRRVMNKRKLQP